MKSILALMLLYCVYSVAFAQNPYHVKGIVADTANNSKLQNATISILNANDSTLYKFARANNTGVFSISPMRKGKFILLLTYPDYADYVSYFTLDSTNTNMDFKQLNMKLKATLLREVIIKGQGAAIKIKGDTTEFNAASYTIQPNDKVEDLLKKLPGIQIDKDGKITAQGKTVPKVLVDGEEFFGDDPTLVTKNLRADMVDKVQLYEKSSDQAAFTGVDDGQKTQTINIKLKEDKKNGYFGKVMGGVGINDRYQSQVMFNRFKGKQKFSFYGTGSNTGKTGLGWQDGDKYGASDQNVQFIDGGLYISGGNNDEIFSGSSSYYGEGIPVALNGGTHYDTKWNADKETLNTNFKIGSLRVKKIKNILEQNNLSTDIFNYETDEQTENYNFRQKLDFTYSIKLDTTSNLKVSADGTLKNNTATNNFLKTGKREDNSLLNKSDRRLDNEGHEKVFNISAFYTKILKKLGRNYSLTLSEFINEKNGEGYVKAKTDFYKPNEVFDRAETIDQFKSSLITSNTFNSNFTYSEPLTKKLTVVLNYGVIITNGSSDRKTFNASALNRYDLLATDYSNDFEASQFAHQGGAVFSYKAAKTTLTWGSKLNAVKFDQYDAYANTRLERNFLNWMPQARYQYRFSQQRSLSVGYNGNTTQPTITQLQPIKVNDDPLNQVIGNENLKPSYRSNVSITYNSYKVLSQESIWMNGNINFTNNQIVNGISTNSSGESTIQAINLKGYTPIYYNFYLDYGRKIKVLNGNLGFTISTYGSTNYNYIRNDLNQSTAADYNFNLSFYKSKEKKYDFRLYAGPGYSIQNTKTSLKAVKNEGWTASGNAYFTVYLPAKFNITGDGSYSLTAATDRFNEQVSQLMINTSLNKTFLKGDELKVSLSGNDLLNQNRGFRRYASGNSIIQNSYNTIKRYFMFSVTYDFNKMGGGIKN